MKEENSGINIVKVLSFLVWVVYQIMRLCLGLVVHPYRTVREIMRGRWFVPLVLLPSGLLFWILLTGRMAAWVVDVPLILARDWLGVFYSTLIISLGMWQALLLYLAVRFRMGLREIKND